MIAGGMLMPLLWTGLCHSFMGIVNPSLQEHVNWFWFIVSQAVYGLAMSIFVVRSQKIFIPPAGSGPLGRRQARLLIRAEGSREFASDFLLITRGACRLGLMLPGVLFCIASGCDLPGRPNPSDRWAPPQLERSFDALYRKNCAGCHGADGKLGPHRR